MAERLAVRPPGCNCRQAPRRLRAGLPPAARPLHGTCIPPHGRGVQLDCDQGIALGTRGTHLYELLLLVYTGTHGDARGDSFEDAGRTPPGNSIPRDTDGCA